MEGKQDKVTAVEGRSGMAWLLNGGMEDDKIRDGKMGQENVGHHHFKIGATEKKSSLDCHPCLDRGAESSPC